mgnify:CR=1 FL=1
MRRAELERVESGQRRESGRAAWSCSVCAHHTVGQYNPVVGGDTAASRDETEKETPTDLAELVLLLLGKAPQRPEPKQARPRELVLRALADEPEPAPAVRLVDVFEPRGDPQLVEVREVLLEDGRGEGEAQRSDEAGLEREEEGWVGALGAVEQFLRAQAGRQLSRAVQKDECDRGTHPDGAPSIESVELVGESQVAQVGASPQERVEEGEAEVGHLDVAAGEPLDDDAQEVGLREDGLEDDGEAGSRGCCCGGRGGRRGRREDRLRGEAAQNGGCRAGDVNEALGGCTKSIISTGPLTGKERRTSSAPIMSTTRATKARSSPAHPSFSSSRSVCRLSSA